MCYYDLATSSSRLSNLSCKLLDHYPQCMNAPRDWTLLRLSCGAVVALSRPFSLYTSVPCAWVPGSPGYVPVNVTKYLVMTRWSDQVYLVRPLTSAR